MSVTVAGTVSLPTNPNCVVYTAEAADLLVGRSWSDVVRIAARCLTDFHASAGLPAVAGFAWRRTLDRKNQRHTRAVMFFVFDGPATSGNLDALEEAAGASPVFWSHSSIERIPANGVLSLRVDDEGLRHVWMRVDGELVLRRLVFREGTVKAARVHGDELGDQHVLAGVGHVEALPPEFGTADRELERMRLVLAKHFAEKIIEADGIVRPAEAEFMTVVFPESLMERLGLDDDRTEREYLAAARDQLPTLLGHHDKLALIGLFFSACYSDGNLDAREMRVLKDAGELLGLTRHEVVKYLQRLW